MKCDSETTTQRRHRQWHTSTIVVGFAPLKPAEFVVIQIQQIAWPDRGPEEEHDGRVHSQSKRFDPYKNFKFRVKWDGKYVAGISKVSGLKRTTEVVKHREGGDPSTSRKSPGRTEYDAHHAGARRHARCRIRALGQQGLELRRRPRGRSLAGGLPQRHHDRNSTTRPARWRYSYKVYRCWVSEYQAVPDLDANANAVAIQHIKLENEGWERDQDVTEPTEPTFNDPS